MYRKKFIKCFVKNVQATRTIVQTFYLLSTVYCSNMVPLVQQFNTPSHMTPFFGGRGGGREGGRGLCLMYGRNLATTPARRGGGGGRGGILCSALMTAIHNYGVQRIVGLYRQHSGPSMGLISTGTNDQVCSLGLARHSFYAEQLQDKHTKVKEAKIQAY